MDARWTDNPRAPVRSSATVRLACTVLVAVLASSGCADDAALTVISPEGLFDPATLDFGQRVIGITHELTAKMSNPNVGDLLVREVRFEPPVDVYAARLGGRTLRGAVLGSGAREDIRVLFAPRDEVDYAARMLVEFQDFAVPLELSGVGRRVLDANLGIFPGSIAFVRTEVGRDVVQTVEIENVGEVTSQIREVRLKMTAREALPAISPFYVTARGDTEPLRDVTIDAKERIQVDVHFRPKMPVVVEDSLEFVLVTGKSTGLPVSGSGARPGNLSCSPAQVEFGNVTRGQSRDLAVTCTAVDGVFTIAELALQSGTSQHFSITTRPADGASLAEGASATLGVRFDSAGLPADLAGGVTIDAAHGAQVVLPLSATVQPPDPASTALTVRLVWDTVTTDLDLHVVRNGEELYDPLNDCFFRVRNPDWGTPTYAEDDPFLDRDDIDGEGPEEVNLAVARESNYDVHVHYYRSPADIPTKATVQILFRGQVALEEEADFASCGQLWHVANVFVDAGSPSVRIRGAVTDARAQARCE